MTKVAIVHPWFPLYREPFFRRLRNELDPHGVSLDVFYGQTPPEWAGRNDGAEAGYATELPTRFYSVGHRVLANKSLAPLKERGPYDLVIMEQAIRNLESYGPLLLGSSSMRRIALWGHGRTYTQGNSNAEEILKRSLTRRADWFFAYTSGGREAVVSHGFDTARTTVIENSVDSTKLSAAVTQARASLEDHTHPAAKTMHRGVYVGGLDASKRIPFLLDAAAEVHASLRQFQLSIIGDGRSRTLVQSFAEENAWCRYLGPLFGREKAEVLASSDVLLIPGRVGLIAVDSFAAGLPIVTTDWPWHAPEFEYLRDGVTALVTPSHPSAYAAEVVSLMTDDHRLRAMKAACWAERERYSIENMVENFKRGIMACLSLAPRRHR